MLSSIFGMYVLFSCQLTEKANATGSYSGFGTLAEGGGGASGGNMTMSAGAPSGSATVRMLSGSMTGNPPTGTGMGGASMTAAAGAGGTSSEPDTGDDEVGYGSHTPAYNTTFLRGWQYTDENGIPSLR